ncbi:hypothetical protein [Actinocatenispora rupis]|uniref:DUF4333 domain-containing protein n=1 Tax=Actinocatenispora rupis TaxID=519421 RepID=A0A8J3N851_9ACTN|nr:hypothetical protein [Actinocatenispora rupis]GID09934.1 hypothetical protein Aru02nite_08230 [Actinocatenispora rupis]
MTHSPFSDPTQERPGPDATHQMPTTSGPPGPPNPVYYSQPPQAPPTGPTPPPSGPMPPGGPMSMPPPPGGSGRRSGTAGALAAMLGPRLIPAILTVVVMVGFAVFYFVISSSHSSSSHADVTNALPQDHGPSGPAMPSPTAPYTTPTPASSPDDHASAKQQVLYELEARVMREAGVEGSATGSCDQDFDGSKNTTVTCTVTFENLHVPFTVDITNSIATATMISYTFKADQKKAPLTAEGVRTAFRASAYGSTITHPKPGTVHCDAKLPKLELVGYAKTTRYKCSFQDGDTGTWNVQDVVITDDGPTFR